MPGRWYEAYERGRPGYPPEALHVPGLSRSATVLDLGAGTGKLTRLLLSRFPHVLAVDPDDEMRSLLARFAPDAELLAGTAEQIPLPDGAVDAVFAAECFHWFDTATALAEVARVLRPGGALVLLWNVPAGPIEPAVADVERLLQPHWPADLDLPLDLNYLKLGRFGSDAWQRAFGDSPFEALEHERLGNPQSLDADGLVAFFASMGWIDGLSDENRSSLLGRVRSLLTSPTYRLPWETHVHWTRRASTATS